MLLIITYFIVSHLLFIYKLSNNDYFVNSGQFNKLLAESYSWVFVFDLYLYYNIVIHLMLIFDRFSVTKEYLRDFIVKCYFSFLSFGLISNK